MKDTPDIWSLSLKELTDITTKNRPDITGGSLVITSACLAVALVRMSLEVSRKTTSETEPRKHLSEEIAILRKIQKRLSKTAEEDLAAFNAYRYPSISKKNGNKQEIQRQALVDAIKIPLASVLIIVEVLLILPGCVTYCKPHMLSDLRAAFFMLGGAAQGILSLVESNVGLLPEEQQAGYSEQVATQSKRLLDALTEAGIYLRPSGSNF